MSYKTSNLYASKVFSEHPLGLWAIDEDIYFRSLISDLSKEINNDNWTLINASVVYGQLPSQNPIQNSEISKLYLLSGSSSTVMQLKLDPISYNSFDEKKDSICFNFYIYIPKTTVIDSIESGFIINEEEYLSEYVVESQDYGFWKKIEVRQDIVLSSDISPVIIINYNEVPFSTNNSTVANSSIFISGISVGQWSEPYNSFNTGGVPQDLPEEIILSLPSNPVYEIKGFEINSYGLNDNDNGYSVVYDKQLLAESSGIPMVYGSKGNISISNKTNYHFFEYIIIGGLYSDVDSIDEEKLDGGSNPSDILLPLDEDNPLVYDGGDPWSTSANEEVPSLIFPSKGFLNDSGKYLSLTAEFWLRINNESTEELRIFGPIGSQDGIYVNGEFITIKIDKYIRSYFVGQWYRPMLIHFVQKSDEVYLMINGEKIISITLNLSDIYKTYINSNSDLLGFYGYEKVHPFEIDVFSIFPYAVSEQVAKRRFVYGQGVRNQESIVQSFGGDLTYIDFPYSGYSSTISFPDRTPWSSGYFNNLKINSNGISLPDSQLPDIIFTNSVESLLTEPQSEAIWGNLERDNFNIQDEDYNFITLSPTDDYDNFYSTINFYNLNKTDYPTKSVYGILKPSNDVDTEQSLLLFSDLNTTNTFEIKINSGSLQYLYNNIVLQSASISSSSAFAIGLDFDKVSETFDDIDTFFSNTDMISLNFAGSGSNKFYGKIFSLTLNNAFMTDKNNLFNDNGIADIEFSSDMYSYIGSYTLKPIKTNSTVFFDIASTGYYEASIPMAYFGKYVTMSDSSKFYDLDLIQFNIDIPYPLYSLNNEDSDNYIDNMVAKCYATLQTKDNVGMISYADYVNTETIRNKRVVNFDDSDIDFSNTKFEISDSTIIFPPKTKKDFKDYYLTIHIELSTNGINTENISIKKMSFASMAFDESSFYPIKSPTGKDIYPVSKVKDTYVYKTQLPVTINNESSTYSYISGNSGISILPIESNTVNALSFPINNSLKTDFRMVGLQMYLMFNESSEFNEEKMFAKFFNDNAEYQLYISPEADKKRARIKIIDSKTNLELDGVKFFLNGVDVTTPVIKPFEWVSLVISLQDYGIDFYNIVPEGIIGELEVYSGVRVDNVAIYSDINESELNLIIRTPWYEIIRDYESWYDVLSASVSASTVWQDIIKEDRIPITVISVDGAEISDTYLGLSRAIGNDIDTISILFDSINIINDADLTNFEYRPI